MTTGSATPSQVTRLLIGSLPLQPAGLLDSLDEPLSGNLVLQVTLNTSLQLHGRTAEFPWPDFDWQVIRSTRHTVISSYVIIYKKLTSIGGPLLTLFNGSKTFASSE